MVDEDGEKLAQEREEHRAVAELTRKEQDYVQALKEVSDWKRLSFRAAQTTAVMVKHGKDGKGNVNAMVTTPN